MTEEQLRQEQEAKTAASDPTLDREAIAAVGENSEESPEAEEIEEIDPSTEEEHAQVERALEDRTLGIEDRT